MGSTKIFRSLIGHALRSWYELKVGTLATRVYILKFHSIEGSLKYLIGLLALKLKGGVDMVSFLIAKSPGFSANSFSFVVVDVGGAF